MARKKAPEAAPAENKPARKSAPAKAGEIAAAVAPKKPATKKAPAKTAKSKAGEATKPQATKKAATKAPAKAKPAPAAETAAQEAEEPLDDILCGLTEREALFIDLYLSSYKVGQSYIDAGFEVKSMAVACAAGSRLLHGVKASKYRAKRIKEMLDRNEEAKDRLLTSLVDMAYADARELSELRVGCCRYCWGEGHKYQFTPREWDARLEKYAQAVEEAEEAGEPEPVFDPLGGVGFLKSREPNEDCPECAGEGEVRVVLKDTQNLSPGALSLYAGAKIGKDGIEVKGYDQKSARETLAKVLKLYDESAKVVFNFDPEELDARFGEKMRESHERMEQMRLDRLGARED